MGITINIPRYVEPIQMELVFESKEEMREYVKKVGWDKFMDEIVQDAIYLMSPKVAWLVDDQLFEDNIAELFDDVDPEDIKEMMEYDGEEI